MTSDPTLAYRESVGHSANPVRLVILLYEQLVKDLQRALSAMERCQVEERTREIDHALIVAGQLQATLDMERGGEVAQNLYRFYEVFRASLIEAEIRLAPEILRAQVRHLLTLREAWIEVEQTSPRSGTPSPPVPDDSTLATVTLNDSQHTDWKA
jgi:flagellar protein FliS